MKKTFLLAAASLCGVLLARVEPSALFSDHALLLSSKDTPIFGFAGSGERVTVSLGGVSATGAADAKGRWLVRLNLAEVGHGPFDLKINDFVAHDVLVGEVWLCSGQSNMSFKMGSADDIGTECHVTNRQIRCFVVNGGAETAPNPRIRGRWLVNEPTQTHAMTAVGYHFAKNLQTELGVPVGIVESAVGASTIEAWCSPSAMTVSPDGRKILDGQIAFMKGYRDYEKRCDAAIRAWERRWQRTDRPHGAAPAAGWRALTEKERATFFHPAGAFWLRRTLKGVPGRELTFSRRRFIEKQWFFDPSSVEVLWNGTRVPCTYPADPIDKNTERYALAVPVSGVGTLDVRMFNAESVRDVLCTFWAEGRRLDATSWQLADEFTLPGMSAKARESYPPRQRFCLRQHYPTGLHNAMIEGLVPMGLSGVVWYQGESNAAVGEASSGPERYADLFTGFIQSWRRLFQKPELPFVWCQLANYTERAKDPDGDLSLALLRASQQKALALPMTGQAVLIDAGEDADIHPRDKRTPGRRLAAWALNRVYGKSTPYRGPNVREALSEGGKVVITFADAGEGLVARDLGTTYVKRTRDGLRGTVTRNSPQAQVEGFALAGADGVWRWADAATIAGNRVTVSAAAVPAPTAVRYGWAKNPWVNLYNADGFPAEPFERKVGSAWKLTPHATRDADIVTVELPQNRPDSAFATLAYDLGRFDDKPFEATIRARGFGLTTPPEKWLGFKFMATYTDRATGQKVYPGAPHQAGDFDWRTVRLVDSRSGVRRGGGVFTLGLQNGCGKVQFDLSSFRVRELPPMWPITNLNHRCVYTDRVKNWAQHRGVMLGHGMKEADFKVLGDWGVTLARFQMTRGWNTPGANRDLADYDRYIDGCLDDLEKELAYAKKYGIRIVVDLHAVPGARDESHDEYMFHDTVYADHFIRTWQKIATRFRDRDEIFGFDLVNEPQQTKPARPGCDYWSLQCRAAEAIRAIDPETPVIIESNLYDGPATFAYMMPLTLTNIIYQAHMYVPMEVTHQGVHDKNGPVCPYPCPEKSIGPKLLRDALEPVLAFQRKHGARIYIGEFSAIAWAPGAGDYIRDCVALFNEYGWDWSYHAFREWKGWSVEHEAPERHKFIPSADNPRKRALLEGFKAN